MCRLYISCLEVRNSKFMLQVKSLQGKLLILVSVILNCRRENALNVIAWDLQVLDILKSETKSKSCNWDLLSVC